MLSCCLPLPYPHPGPSANDVPDPERAKSKIYFTSQPSSPSTANPSADPARLEPRLVIRLQTQTHSQTQGWAISSTRPHDNTRDHAQQYLSGLFPTNNTPKMSVLPAEVHTALSQLLQGLQSTDNTLRSQAEEQLNTEWVSKSPDVLLMGLIEQMSGSQETGVRIPH